MKRPIFYRRGKYVVDYRSQGIRLRTSFETMKAAADHWEQVNAKMAGMEANALKPVVLAPMEIKQSIAQFRKVVDSGRSIECKRIEKYYFEQIFVFLLNECKIRFVHEITQFHLEMFRTSLSEKGLKASTVNRQFNCYRAWLNKCLSWDLIAKNPMAKVGRLGEVPPDIKTWSEEKTAGANKVVLPWLKDVLFFLDRSGRRPIDAARATFGDIDEANKMIKVRSFKGGKIKEQYFQLADDLFERIMEIKELSRREFRAKDTDVIFLNSRKTPVTTNTIGQALRRAGIRDVTPYGLRHTFADGLVDDGVHARDIQLLMGHAKFETTTRYTHRDTKHLRVHVEKRAQKRGVQRVV